MSVLKRLQELEQRLLSQKVSRNQSRIAGTAVPPYQPTPNAHSSSPSRSPSRNGRITPVLHRTSPPPRTPLPGPISRPSSAHSASRHVSFHGSTSPPKRVPSPPRPIQSTPQQQHHHYVPSSQRSQYQSQLPPREPQGASILDVAGVAAQRASSMRMPSPPRDRSSTLSSQPQQSEQRHNDSLEEIAVMRNSRVPQIQPSTPSARSSTTPTAPKPMPAVTWPVSPVSASSHQDSPPRSHHSWQPQQRTQDGPTAAVQAAMEAAERASAYSRSLSPNSRLQHSVGMSTDDASESVELNASSEGAHRLSQSRPSLKATSGTQTSGHPPSTGRNDWSSNVALRSVEAEIVKFPTGVAKSPSVSVSHSFPSYQSSLPVAASPSHPFNSSLYHPATQQQHQQQQQQHQQQQQQHAFVSQSTFPGAQQCAPQPPIPAPMQQPREVYAPHSSVSHQPSSTPSQPMHQSQPPTVAHPFTDRQQHQQQSFMPQSSTSNPSSTLFPASQLTSQHHSFSQSYIQPGASHPSSQIFASTPVPTARIQPVQHENRAAEGATRLEYVGFKGNSMNTQTSSIDALELNTPSVLPVVPKDYSENLQRRFDEAMARRKAEDLQRLAAMKREEEIWEDDEIYGGDIPVPVQQPTIALKGDPSEVLLRPRLSPVKSRIPPSPGRLGPGPVMHPDDMDERTPISPAPSSSVRNSVDAHYQGRR